MSRQPRMFISVDLPEPDGPITATDSPDVTVSEKLRSAATSGRRGCAAGASRLATSAPGAAATSAIASATSEHAGPVGARHGARDDRDHDDLVELQAGHYLDPGRVGRTGLNRDGPWCAVFEQLPRASGAG